MSILEKLAAGHTFGGGPEDVASFQADQDESGDPRLQMQYTPEMNDEMTQALMRIIQERATQPPPEEKPKGMNPILKGALGGAGIGALGGAGFGGAMSSAPSLTSPVWGRPDLKAMLLGGGAGALLGGAGGALGGYLGKPKEAVDKVANPITALNDAGFSGETPEDWEKHIKNRRWLVDALMAANMSGAGALGGTAIGAAFKGRPGLGAAIGAGAGALGSLPFIVLGRREMANVTPGEWERGFKIHKERREKKASAFDQGYFDALAKLGFDPKATSGGPLAQAVLPKKPTKAKIVNKSDAGF